jgi:deoxyribodipyrimidine photo-lyase
MQNSRIAQLNKKEFDGTAVIYVMSRDQRVQDNHALIAAQLLAIEHKVPLYVFFNLRAVSGRSHEHYQFMLDGLQEVAKDLKKLNIPFVLQTGDAVENILTFADEAKAGALFFDFSPLKGPRSIATSVASAFKGAVSIVDTHNVIPVWIASDKQEFAAHTMRRKVHKYLENYIKEPPQVAPHKTPPSGSPASVSFSQAREFIQDVPAAGITIDAVPGEKAAHEHLNGFLTNHLTRYAVGRNDIAEDQQSRLSPYLHYGQLSSLRVALETIKATDRRPLLFEEIKLASPGETPSDYDGMNALLEEMVVRKELADNFCFYADDYRTLTSGPKWAQQSLAEHANDPREFIYTRQQWEEAATHDQSWNAAQNQLRKTGKMHGYMRMYWAKKMLEWSESPERALKDCIYLNDKYSIDGGDPNGYVGILWSIVGLHDRPWFERPVFGKIRYMNEGGLMRKYDVARYISRWNG